MSPASPLPPPCEDWLASLTARGLASRSVSTYRVEISLFASALGRDPSDATDDEVRSHLARGVNGEEAPRTTRKRLAALRSFFDFLIERGRRPDHPASGVRGRKVPRGLPEVVYEERMARILRELPGDGRFAARDAFLLELLYNAGLRVGEVAGLRWKHVEAEALRVRGKGDKVRIVPLTSFLKKLCDDLRPPDAEAPLIPNRYGSPLGPRGVQKRIATLAARAGLPERIHPHFFRHAFATHLLRGGADLREVQELLGHADPSTTQIYTRLTEGDLKKAISGHPLAKPLGKRTP